MRRRNLSERTIASGGSESSGQADGKGRPPGYRRLRGRHGGEGDHGRQGGFFVAFSYSRDAEQECAAFHKRTGRIIKLLTVQEILDEEHVQKM